MSKAEITAIRKERVSKIQPLVTQGIKPSEIGRIIGLDASIVRHLIRRYCDRPEGYVNPNLSSNESMMDWQSECDPSVLTDDQREHAKRVGITEGRYAWLLSCPRDVVPVRNQEQT
jgi:hypothetical protein